MEWLKMNVGNVIVLSILLIIVGGIVFRMIQNRRKGKTGCSACSACCGCSGKNCGK